MSNSTHSFWKEWFLVIQGLFYFTQGFAFAAAGYFTIYITSVFSIPEADSIRYGSLIMLPWYIKIVIGVISDKFAIGKFGRRRPYILISSVLGLFGWAFIGIAKEFNFLFLLALLFVTFNIATVDVIFDAFGVDVAPANRRSLWQGVGWGMRGLGGLIGAILFGILSNRIGWTIAFYVVGGVSAIGGLITIVVKEPKDETGKIIGSSVAFKELFQPFKTRLVWLSTLFNICAGIAITATTIFSLFLSKRIGLNTEEIGYIAAIGAIGQFLGASLAGYLGHKIEFKKVFIGSTLLYVVWLLLFLSWEIWHYPTSFVLLLIVSLSMGIINAIYETSCMRLAMEYSVSNSAGTLYAWYMSMENIGQLLIGSLIMAYIIEVSGMYLVAIQIGTIFLLIALIPGLIAIKKWKSPGFKI